MRFLQYIVGASVLVSSASAQSVDSYVASEGPVAKKGLFANIGPNGSKDAGAGAGLVTASPSTANPDYTYSWTRDSSLVFKVIVDQYTLGIDTSTRGLIDSFFAAEARLQQVSNPSGSVSSGGLGEPKFNLDFTAFTGAWGRPQRDGPALRATTLMSYGTYLYNADNKTFVTSTLWPVIKLDLDYVAADWNLTTFDLWEEVSSSSFFTTAVQHRALRQGAIFSTLIGQSASSTTYTTQAANVLCFLQSYWNPNAGYITANTGGGRSGKDSNTVLASIHTWDIAAGCDATTFQPCSDKALSNLKVYVDSFRSIYSINSGISSSAAVATGRYPEDVYYNGNPWYLTTLAVAEQLYDAITTWKSVGTISVTSTSLPFWKQLNSGIAVGSYASSSTTYTTLISAVKTYADGFVAEVQKYTPSNGGLSEQFDKSSGVPLSAVDLTWSYASAITAFMARNGTVTPSWGAKGLTIPSQCSTGSGGSGGGSTVAVTFNVQATTVLGENIYITGSVDALQNWSPTSALLLSSANYPTWSITVNLPASSTIQYKYIRINNGAVTWESDPNMSITTPASGTYSEHDTWR